MPTSRSVAGSGGKLWAYVTVQNLARARYLSAYAHALWPSLGPVAFTLYVGFLRLKVTFAQEASVRQVQ